MKHDYSGILDFFRTGQLGELRLGMSVDEVVDYFGDDYIQRGIFPDKHRNIYRTILCYGILDILAINNALEHITLHISKYPEYALPDALDSRWLPFFYTMTMRKFHDFAIEHHLKICVTPIHSHLSKVMVVTGKLYIAVSFETMGFDPEDKLLKHIMFATYHKLPVNAKPWQFPK
ncbi:MAG: hypothetical protein ACPG7F_10085 [Aggregatilineales bacterium]